MKRRTLLTGLGARSAASITTRAPQLCNLQLGLRLQRSRVQVEPIMIDHLGKSPTENRKFPMGKTGTTGLGKTPTTFYILGRGPQVHGAAS